MTNEAAVERDCIGEEGGRDCTKAAFILGAGAESQSEQTFFDTKFLVRSKWQANALVTDFADASFDQRAGAAVINCAADARNCVGTNRSVDSAVESLETLKRKLASS